MSADMENVTAEIEQITSDIQALDRVRAMLVHQRESLVVTTAAAADLKIGEEAAQSFAVPTVEANPDVHALDPDPTRIPALSVRTSAFQGKTLWQLAGEGDVHIRVPSPNAGTMLCGLAGEGWVSYQPGLSGYVWTCGDCYEAMRAI